MDTKFSIVLPVYNCADCLSQMLQSIAAQTERDWECICVDDGSTDRSGRILDDFALADNRFRVIHQTNKGVSGARNVGLNAISGSSEYFFILDSDDYISPDFIEYHYNKAKGLPPNSVVVTGWLTFTDKQEDFVESRPKLADGWYERLCPEYCFECGGLWNKIFPMTLLGNTRFYENCFFGEDTAFVTTLLARSNGILMDSSYRGYHYRVRPLSVSHGRSFAYCAHGYWNGTVMLMGDVAGKNDHLLKVWGVRCMARHMRCIFHLKDAYRMAKIINESDCGGAFWRLMTDLGELNSENPLELFFAKACAWIFSKKRDSAFCFFLVALLGCPTLLQGKKFYLEAAPVYDGVRKC